MKYLIIGGCGFIGTYIAKRLAEKGNEVICFDLFLNYVDPSKSNYDEILKMRLRELKGKAEIIRGDIRSKGLVAKTIREKKPDVIINLAAIPIATKANEFPEESHGINLNGLVNILEAIRENGSVERFIQTSSSFVYGDFDYEPADEKHPTKPIDVYGGTKLAGEILTQAYSKKFEIPHTIIRPSAVYGSGDANRRVTQQFILNALEEKPLKLFNGGLEKIDFTYVSDTASGFILASESKKARNETFNITAGNAMTVKKFAEVLKKTLPSIKVQSNPTDMIRPMRGSLDISKAKELLGYEPQTNLEEGIQKYLKGIKENRLVW